MKIKCVVSCRDANGVPTFYPVEAEATAAEYEDGDHYERAAAAATAAGYESVGLVYDENDGPAWLFARLFGTPEAFEYDAAECAGRLTVEKTTYGPAVYLNEFDTHATAFVDMFRGNETPAVLLYSQGDDEPAVKAVLEPGGGLSVFVRPGLELISAHPRAITATHPGAYAPPVSDQAMPQVIGAPGEDDPN